MNLGLLISLPDMLIQGVRENKDGCLSYRQTIHVENSCN